MTSRGAAQQLKPFRASLRYKSGYWPRNHDYFHMATNIHGMPDLTLKCWCNYRMWTPVSRLIAQLLPLLHPSSDYSLSDYIKYSHSRAAPALIMFPLNFMAGRPPNFAEEATPDPIQASINRQTKT